MVRILYGVAGEGMGHAVRTRPIVECLLAQGHEVRIVAGGRAFRYLASRFVDVLEIAHLPIIYRDGAAHDSLTAVVNVLRFPLYARSFREVWRLVSEWRPDAIITDFEFLTSYVALLRGIPLLSVGNHQVLTKSEVTAPIRYWVDAVKTRFITWLMTPFAGLFIVFWPDASREVVRRAIIVQPPVRIEVLRLKPTAGKHVLVYQTSDSNRRLLDVLKGVDAEFVVYGYHRSGRDGNLLFREFNERRFFKDLAACRAVITNGGFSLTSESLVLGKPVLICPVRKQYEQIFNAVEIERLGYGRFVEVVTPENIALFLGNLSRYARALGKYRHDGNVGCLGEIDGFIRRVS